MSAIITILGLLCHHSMLRSSCSSILSFPLPPRFSSSSTSPFALRPPSHSKLVETIITSLNASSASWPCLPWAQHSAALSNQGHLFSCVLQVPQSLEIRLHTACCPMLFPIHYSFSLYKNLSSFWVSYLLASPSHRYHPTTDSDQANLGSQQPYRHSNLTFLFLSCRGDHFFLLVLTMWSLLGLTITYNVQYQKSSSS